MPATTTSPSPAAPAHAAKTLRADRLLALPPYLFAEIDRKKRAARAAGKDLIDLGIGDPDRPTPAFILDAMEKAIRNPANHRYPSGNGSKEFRDAAARFMLRRFNVRVDPDRHITACIGSKDGISHLPLALVNPGEVVCIPAPAYPVYRAGATFAGAQIHEMPLLPENSWLPRFSQIPADIARRTKLLWTNYPNNPTAASADVSFYDELIDFCAGTGAAAGTVAISDQAYSEIYFEQPPVSLWQSTRANPDATLAVEFHSLSKTFNMTGWRIAFAVGHPEVVGALAALKENCDSGQFTAIQQAGAVALDHTDHPDVAAMREVYRRRRDALIPGLREIGCHVEPPRAGFFVWARCPLIDHRPGSGKGALMDSMEFCSRALEEAGVVVVPGSGFAESGRHYFRIALTVEEDRIREAVQRLKKVDWRR